MPVVLENYADWIDAFYEASSERQIGMGYGQVPFGAIEQQAKRLGLIEEIEFEIFLSVMRSLDSVYLKHMNSRNEDVQGQDKQRVASRPMSMPLFDSIFTGG